MFYRACTRIFPQADENVWVRGVDLPLNSRYGLSYYNEIEVDFQRRRYRGMSKRKI
jgi:hypothetical protein